MGLAFFAVCFFAASAAAADTSFCREYVYDDPDTTPVVFEGWSRSMDAEALDYTLWMDVTYADGTPKWGVRSGFRRGTHGWEFTRGIFQPEKPVAKIKLYAFLRKGNGLAEFKDVKLERRATNDVEWIARTRRTNRPFRDEIVEEDTFRHGVHYSLKNRVLPGSIGPTSPLPADAACVWAVDSMRLVTPLTFPGTNEMDSCRSIDIELAKGEAESAQIVVSTGVGCELAGCTVSVSRLMSEEGTPFSGEVKWERVGYLARRNGYSSCRYSAREEERWLPDPLLPAARFRVRKGCSQGVWVTVKAGRDAKSGIYHGVAHVIENGAELASVPMRVHVRGFAQPETFGMKTAFCVMDGFIKAQYGDRFDEMRRRAWDVMLDHRLNPDDISRTSPPRIDELVHARKRGMNCFNVINLVPPVDCDTNKWVWIAKPEEIFTPEFYRYVKRVLTPYVKRLKENGLLEYAYVYGFDERGRDYYEGIDAFWRSLKIDFPDLPLMTTAGMYRDMAKGGKDPLLKATDWYCPLSRDYDQSLSERLRLEGKQVWWYVCCVPKYPYANFASYEYPLIDGRALGWQTHLYRADGLLYWHVNNWNDNQGNLDASDTFFPEWDTHSGRLHMPGDGILLYPMEDGIAPSIRLAQIRDGVEDYERLQMVARLHGVKEADDICRSFMKSKFEFSRNPRDLLAARARLGLMLERQPHRTGE